MVCPNGDTPAAAKHPCSFQTPWDMVIIFDELAPGNKLHCENRRKLMLMSLSFLQLEETLRVDDSWLTVLATRASIVGDVCGGFGTVFAKYIEAIASTPDSPLTAGAFVTVNNAPRLLVAKVTCVVADGDGHRQVLNWKGASSTSGTWRCTSETWRCTSGRQTAESQRSGEGKEEGTPTANRRKFFRNGSHGNEKVVRMSQAESGCMTCWCCRDLQQTANS